MEADLTTLINESKNHSANAAWGLTNELTRDSACGTAGQVLPQNCVALLISALQLIQQLDDSDRPVTIVHVLEDGFVSPKAVQSALVTAGMSTFLSSRMLTGLNLYFEGQSPETQAISFAGVLEEYFTDPELSPIPLMIGEYGQ